MQGTIRTFSPAVRETVLTRLKVLLDGVTAGMGARYELEIQDVTGAVVNDAAMAEIARAAAVQVVGATNVAWQPPFMVSRTSRSSPNRVPACFMLLGSGNPELGLNAPHHNPRFDFDERALPLGAALLATAAAKFLSERPYAALNSLRNKLSLICRIEHKSSIMREPEDKGDLGLPPCALANDSRPVQLLCRSNAPSGCSLAPLLQARLVILP